MKPYPVYLFDLYGTLADIHTDESPAAFWDGVAACLLLRGAGYTGKTLQKTYLALCRDEVRLRAETLPDVPEEFVEPELLHVFLRLLPNADEADAKALAQYFRKRSTLRLKTMPQAHETLDALHARGAKLYLLSNAQSCFTREELDALDLTRRFDGILLSSDAGMKKPYRGLFEQLLETYAIAPGTALMVGNDAIADIAGADAVGLDSAYYHTWSSGPRPNALPQSCTGIAGLSALL